MTATPRGRDETRARRLLRWYPRSWRDRYAEEFTELLLEDFADQPASWRRTVSVIGGGMSARLSLIGLRDGATAAPARALATIGVAVAVFIACGMSLWEQLLTGSRMARPHSSDVSIGVVVMTATLAYLAIVAVCAAIPPTIAAARSVRRTPRAIAGPVMGLAVGAVSLVVGGYRMAARWPGNAHAASHQLVPAGIGGFSWSETLGISTYWAHPHDLIGVPSSELAWMVISPIAAVLTVASAVRLIRRLTWSPSTLAYEARLARAASAGMVPFLGVAAWWVVASHRGPADVFRAGALDVGMILVMIASLAVAGAARQRLTSCGASAAAAA